MVSKDHYVEDIASAIYLAMSKCDEVKKAESIESIKEAFGLSFKPFASITQGENVRFYAKFGKAKIQFALELEEDGTGVMLTVLNLKAKADPTIH